MTVRVASLFPGATEIMCALGLGERLVAVSHACELPGELEGLPRVTRSWLPEGAPSGEIDRAVREHARAGRPLYALDAEGLAAAAPDLILTQRLCGVCAVSDGEVRAVLRALPGAPALLDLEPRGLADVLGAIRAVARATGAAGAGERLVNGLSARIARVAARSERMARRPVVAFLEWLDPIFAGGHWNPELVRLAGGVDPLGRPGEAAGTVSWAEVAACEPDALFVACCGYDEEHTVADLALLAARAGEEWDALPAVRAGRVHVVDGTRFFSRPGPALVDGLELLAHALDPDAHASPARGTPAPAVGIDDLRRTLAAAADQ